MSTSHEKRKRLDDSSDMDPVAGTVDVSIPADELWAQFKRPNFWPRWNKCFLWCFNRDLRVGKRLVWAFEPTRRLYLYKFPAIANIVEVKEDETPLRRVTWEVTALPGFYARHSYTVEKLGDGTSRFGSWEKAQGWSFRLMRLFWIAHFRFVRDKSLEGARFLESVYRRERKLDVASLPRRSYLKFWLVVLALSAVLGVGGWFYTAYVRLSSVDPVPGVRVVLGGGGNSVIIEGNLKDRIDDQWDKPVRFLVNTHYHYDHTQGNVLYPGASIIAHKDVPNLMLSRDGEWWRNGRLHGIPTVLVEDQAEYRVGDKKVVLFHPGPAHTQADLVVVFPDLQLVALGDLMFHTYYPFFDEESGGADIRGIVRVLREMVARHPEATFIPGHGPPVTASDVKQYADHL